MVIKTVDIDTGVVTTSVAGAPAPPSIFRLDIDDLVETHNKLALIPGNFVLRDRHWERFDRSTAETDANGNVQLDPIFPSHLWYYGLRSYTDFCNGGDLDKLLTRYCGNAGRAQNDPERQVLPHSCPEQIRPHTDQST